MPSYYPKDMLDYEYEESLAAKERLAVWWETENEQILLASIKKRK